MTTILGIKLLNRLDDSNKFQNILSKFGCSIKTRIGLHNICSNTCNNWGIILLEVIDDKLEIYKLKQELLQLDDIKVNIMTL